MIATLKRLKNTMTIVVVAHRPQTIQSADDVVVLQHGRVAAQGSRATIYARSAVFRDMFTQDERRHADAA